MRSSIDPNQIALGMGSLLMAVAFAAGCAAEEQTGFPAGIYEVTLQTGSSAEERPECLDDSLLIADVVALYDPEIEDGEMSEDERRRQNMAAHTGRGH